MRRHQHRTVQFGVVALALVFVQASSAVPSNWLIGESGNWTDASRWSTSSAPINGLPAGSGNVYEVLIDAAALQGYAVTVDTDVQVDTMTLSNIDARVEVDDPFTFTANAVNVQQGRFNLNRGILNAATVNVGPDAVFGVRHAEIKDAVLTGKFTKVIETEESGGGHVILDDSRLDNASISIEAGLVKVATRPALGMAAGSALLGTGEIVFNDPLNVELDHEVPRVSGVTLLNATFTIDSGITLRTGTSSGLIDGSIIDLRGTVIADTPDSQVLIDGDKVFNNGSISASNQGHVKVRGLSGAVGNVSLGEGSTIELSSGSSSSSPISATWDQTYSFDGGSTENDTTLDLSGKIEIVAPIVATDGATLKLSSLWTNTADVTVNNAKFFVSGHEFDTSKVFVTNSEITIDPRSSSGEAILTTESLEQISRGGNRLFVGGGLDNVGRAFDLDNWVGNVIFDSDASHQNAPWFAGGSIVSARGSRIVIVGEASLHEVDIDVKLDLIANADVRFNFSNATLPVITRKDVSISDGTGLKARVHWINHGHVAVNGGRLTIESQWENFGQIDVDGGILEFAGTNPVLGGIAMTDSELLIGAAITTAQFRSIGLTNTRVTFGDLDSQSNGIRLDNRGEVLTLAQPIYIESGVFEGGEIRGDASLGHNLIIGRPQFRDVVLGADLIHSFGGQGPSFRGQVIMDDILISISDDDDAFHEKTGIDLTLSDGLVGSGEVQFSGPGDVHSITFARPRINDFQIIDENVTVRTVNGGGILLSDSNSGRPHPDLVIEGNVLAHGHPIEFRHFPNLINRGRIEATDGARIFIKHNSGINPTSWANDGFVLLDDGTLELEGDTLINNVDGRIEGHGSIVFAGRSDLSTAGADVVDAGNAVTSNMINHGTIAPEEGRSLAIDANLTMTDTAVLVLRPSELVAVDHDQLIVQGDANIAGTLDLKNDSSYIATLGDELVILEAENLVGQFSTITNVVIGNGLGMAVRYHGDLPGTSRPRASVRVSKIGDVDFDDDVDTGDITDAIANYNGATGTGKTWISGDFDGDGNTDTADLTAAILGFTGASAVDPNIPDLVYDPVTGNMLLDTVGQDVISFSLQGGPFNIGNTDFSDLPAGLTDNIANQIGWTSFNIGGGLVGTADLGAILPAGLSNAQFLTALAGGANYGLSVVIGGGGPLDLVYLPEPTSMVLMGIGTLALVCRRNILRCAT